MKNAFTLIELLVVLAIIAAMMGILIPTLKLVKDQARRVECLSNQKQLSVGTFAYAFDYNEFLPLAATQYENPRTASIGNVGPPTWDQRIWPYVESDKRIFACQTISLLSDQDTERIPRTYTINAVITGLDDLESLFGYTRTFRLTNISQPGVTLLYGEHFWPSWIGEVPAAVFHNWSLVRPIHSVRYNSHIFETPWEPDGAQEAFGITNFTFADGHSDSIQTTYTKKEGDPVEGVKFTP